MNQSNLVPKELETQKPPTADEIAELADTGEDISHFFTRKGKMMPSIMPQAENPSTFLYEI